MRSLLILLVALAATVSCAPATRSSAETDSPEALLEAAIARAGGTDALRQARALSWDGEATVQAGERTVRIAGTWAVQPPDTAVVETYDVTRGPATARALVVAAPRGWIVSGDQFTPMPDALLASERDEFFFYQAMRLVPLRDGGARLTRIAPATIGHRGLRAELPGRPAVELYVDADGRLAHLRMQVRSAEDGTPTWQDAWLTGTVEDAGVRWPREIRLDADGSPFFTLTVRALRVRPRVEDARLQGPR